MSDHVVTGIFTLLGLALGLFGERWVRRRGDVRCSIDSWHNVTDTGMPNEEREVEATFLNEKDVNAVVWNIQVVFHKEDQDPVCPTLTFWDGPSRGQVVGVLNLPPWVAVTRRMKVSLYYPDDLQKAKEADRAEFVATIAGSVRSGRNCDPPGTNEASPYSPNVGNEGSANFALSEFYEVLPTNINLAYINRPFGGCAF